jgi:REP element-mobilizing transposase RayT
MKRMNRTKQLELSFPPSWGGKRKRAGRKLGVRPATPHRARGDHRQAHPVHVTMRSTFRPLRHAFVFPTLRDAIAAANRRDSETFRIVHFSVQHDHLHLIVEAADKLALSSGMRGLAVRIARRVNSLVSRSGTFWGDRWHGRELASPRATRHVLRYVLTNFRKHNPRSTAAIDRYSSAPFFNGFREYAGRMPIGAEVGPSRAQSPPRISTCERSTVKPRSWLLRIGWKRLGLISVYDRPS